MRNLDKLRIKRSDSHVRLLDRALRVDMR